MYHMYYIVRFIKIECPRRMHPAAAYQTCDPASVGMARAGENYNKTIVIVREPRLAGAFERDSRGCAAARPSPASPYSPAAQLALLSPTPNTSTCLRRGAKAKARGKNPRTKAKICQVDGWLANAAGI